jgi:hypothetical protein
METAETSTPSNDDLQRLLAHFDAYSQKLLCAVDGSWNTATRMQSIEYTIFLYGAALAIVRGYGQGDAFSPAILVPYLSRFLGAERAMRWLVACEQESATSRRLKGVHAAGANTAQAVLAAASQGRAQSLNGARNSQVLFSAFSELRRLMDDQDAPDDGLFAASCALYDSVVGT